MSNGGMLGLMPRTKTRSRGLLRGPVHVVHRAAVRGRHGAKGRPRRSTRPSLRWKTASTVVWACCRHQAARTPTSGSIGGSLEPGGTATFEISFPVDPEDVAGRTTFVITDCVFIDGEAALKYSSSFVPNTENFILTFTLQIPAGTPIGAEYCNYAKTTAAPSQSQASNRKAGPACFVVGGNISINKVNEDGDPLAGATFHIVCTLPTTNASMPDTIIDGVSHTLHLGWS